MGIERNQAHSDRDRDSFKHILSSPAFYRFGFFLANRIPSAALYAAADLVGDVSRARYKARDLNIRQNLQRVFPEYPLSEIADISKRLFRNYARTLVDYGRYRGMPLEEIGGEIPRFEGGEHIDDMFRSGEGTILVTGHVGNWELGGLFFVFKGMKVNVVTLPDNVSQINSIRAKYRAHHKIGTIVLDGSPFAMLEMMAALRRGEMVAMLLDRWEGDGVRANFFGKSLLLPRGPFALSRATGAKILPAFVVREEHSNDYRGILDPPFLADGLSDEVYARIVTKSLERIIKRYPDQWYNFEPFGL